jgi:RNA polymerase sigma factor (sigma-70 family)
VSTGGEVGVVGDEELFASLYPKLRRFAAVVAPVEMDPDDLVQEAAVRMLRVGRLGELRDPAAYLRTVMFRLAANERRRLGRRRQAFRRAGDTDRDDARYPSDLADLQRLSVATRAVLFLAVVEGWSYAEIGRRLGCREATARARASRGLRRLRRELSGEAQDA